MKKSPNGTDGPVDRAVRAIRESIDRVTEKLTKYEYRMVLDDIEEDIAQRREADFPDPADAKARTKEGA